jgi:hypothetical protein
MTRRLVLGLLAIVFVLSVSLEGIASQGDTRIKLAGTGGAGAAKYRSRAGVREFEVEAEHLHVAVGTRLRVAVNGKVVGTMTVTSLRQAHLSLSTQRGQAVPTIAAGSAVTVLAPNGVVLVAGKF